MKMAYLRYSEKRYRLAKRRALEASEAFIDDYRWRAGVEATMSEFDRRTGVKKLRVGGIPAVRFYARLKASGEWVVEPAIDKEELIITTLDYEFVLMEWQNFDPAEHYSRPDVTQLTVNRKRQSTIKMDD